MRKIIAQSMLMLLACFVSLTLAAQAKEGQEARSKSPNPKAHFAKLSKEQHLKNLSSKVLAKTKFTNDQNTKVIGVYNDFLNTVELQQKNGTVPSKDLMNKTLAKKDNALKKILTQSQFDQFMREEKFMLMEAAREKGMGAGKAMEKQSH